MTSLEGIIALEKPSGSEACRQLCRFYSLLLRANPNPWPQPCSWSLYDTVSDVVERRCNGGLILYIEIAKSTQTPSLLLIANPYPWLFLAEIADRDTFQAGTFWGVLNVSLHSSGAQLGGAPTDLLWSKKCDATHGGPQLISFGPKNAKWLKLTF